MKTTVKSYLVVLLFPNPQMWEYVAEDSSSDVQYCVLCQERRNIALGNNDNVTWIATGLRPYCNLLLCISFITEPRFFRDKLFAETTMLKKINGKISKYVIMLLTRFNSITVFLTPLDQGFKIFLYLVSQYSIRRKIIMNGFF